MNKEQLGTFVKDKRIELGLTQTQLADKTNISYQRIIEIEKNRRSYSVEVLFQVLHAIGFKVSLIPIGQPPQFVGITNARYKMSTFKIADPTDTEQVNNFNQIKIIENETL